MAHKDKFFSKKNTINCRGYLLDLAQPIVMGILNITPDSFYSGSRYQEERTVRTQLDKMLEDGASIMDLGAYSSRPGATDIPEEQEWERLEPVLQMISKNYPKQIFSLDTFRAGIAQKAVEHYNISIINDISAGDMDPAMIDTIARLKVPYIAMHMQGTPQTMQQNPSYEDIAEEVVRYFAQKCDQLREAGIHDIIIDPGFGFGKTIAHNFELLNNLDAFKVFEMPVLAGLSRKSMIFKTLGQKPEDSLNGTTVINTLALLGGADILRVHDVKEAVETIKLVKAFQEASGN